MSLPPVAIVAGGAATRLGDLTRACPKSMIEVAGQPFIAHQLRLLRRRGVERVVLLVGRFADQIHGFVGDGSSFDLAVSYAFDGDAPLGTGGAVANALPLLGDSFIVTYGDAYLDVPLEPLIGAKARAGCVAAMAVHHNRDLWDPSNVVFDGERVLLHEKGSSGPGVEWIDYGLTAFDSAAFAGIVAGTAFDLSDLTAQLAREGRLAGVEVHNRFYEIGKPSGLSDTEVYLRRSEREDDSGAQP